MRVLVSMLLFAAFAASPFPAKGMPAGIPFTLHRGHLVLARGAIGHFRELVFLVDTGAGRTLVAKAVTDRFGLRGRPTKLQSFAQSVSAEEIHIPDLTFGPVRVENPAVLATDLSNTASALQLERLDGIVGIDVLRRTSFAIDYTRQRLRFDTAGALPHRASFVPHPVLLAVTARIGEQSLRLIVDSGASHLVLFRFPPGHVTPLAIVDEPVHLGGKATVRPILLPQLQIGTWPARSVTAVVMEGAASQTAQADGLLGLPALGASIIQFDFRALEIAWK